MRSILDMFDKGRSGNSSGREVKEIPVEEIQPSRYQPRLNFDEESLNELCASIKEQGLIQPITVRKIDSGYEIIAGERRFRACRMAGFKTIPCYILSPSEDEAAQMALVENVQREDLTAIEEARSYVQIMRQCNLTQTQMAEKIGKSQSAVANKIRLLNLPDEIQNGVLEGKITERHARALLTVPEDKQKTAYHYIEKNGLNVAQSEAYISKMNEPKKVHKRQKTRGFAKNVQIGINSVNQCVALIKKMGIAVKVDTQETDGEVRMIVRFPKE